MATLTVFVFLLENLPGFEPILNSTLNELTNDSFINASVSQCDPVMGDIVWKKINGKKNNINNKLTYKDNYVDNLVQPEDINEYINNNVIELDEKNSDNNFNSTFFVAIFETYLNITAQTCGGALVAPQWVLTAATCVDLLSNVYENKNSSILHSHYYIIANAVNPLIDGSVHNVTEIIFQPKHYVKSELITRSPLYLRSQIKIPSLAILRIEPAVHDRFIGIESVSLTAGLKVDIYTWGLTKNSNTKQDTMTVTTFEAITLESNECKVNYSFIEDNSLICLFVLDATDLETHQMSSGGPVVISVGNKFLMAAVAQYDSHSKFVGYSLQPHYSWIQKVITK